MKEKHPETETSCIYCIAGQPHPRLARGETYTCGYKPYRCEVCNYSTTTKGNLSIHMQSDKHLNNMQELQNGGVSSGESAITGPGLHSQGSQSSKAGLVSPSSGGSGGSATGSGHHHHSHTPLSSGSAGVQSQKPKPTFRCDVCNYETNVARNLRIHMTSEKHTHNMMVLQQNMKHMQTLNVLHQHHPHQLESLLHFHPGLTLPGDKPPPHTEAALADMAYNQALLIQMMTGGQLPPHIPPELAPHMDMGLNPDTMEPPPEPADPNPSHLFHCCVCNVFSTDSLEALSHHLSADRTKIREQEILAVVAGHYVCKLCTYKTNLKANFQLHCKTDKHLQRLQHVNHVKEGGLRNEWKLRHVSSPGGIQVRCHACDYYTNSAHKLQLHAAGQRHEASCLLFMHLRESEALTEAPRIYHCALCGFSSRAKLQLLQHVRSMKHLQMEQIHQLQRRSEGKDLQTDIGEVFQVISQLDPQGFGDSEPGKGYRTHLYQISYPFSRISMISANINLLCLHLPWVS
jgi:AT-binding transcription factor 1